MKILIYKIYKKTYLYVAATYECAKVGKHL